MALGEDDTFCTRCGLGPSRGEKAPASGVGSAVERGTLPKRDASGETVIITVNADADDHAELIEPPDEWFHPPGTDIPRRRRGGAALASPPRSSRERIVTAIVLGVCLLPVIGVVSALNWYYNRDVSLPGADPAPVSTPTPTPSPTPKPTPKATPTPTPTPTLPAGVRKCSDTAGAGAGVSCGLALAIENELPSGNDEKPTFNAISPVSGTVYRITCVRGPVTRCTGGRAIVVYVIK